MHYGYKFNKLNTFKRGLLKKTVFTHPVQDGPESPPLGLECSSSEEPLLCRLFALKGGFMQTRKQLLSEKSVLTRMIDGRDQIELSFSH